MAAHRESGSSYVKGTFSSHCRLLLLQVGFVGFIYSSLVADWDVEGGRTKSQPWHQVCA